MSQDRSTSLLDVVVVGAGISGLTAAYWLSQAGLAVTVLEGSNRGGGSISTVRDGPWLFERGPNTIMDADGAVGDLVRSCGLDGERIEASPRSSRRFIWKKDRLHPLPSNPLSLISTSLFSLRAKLSLLGEPWRAPRLSPEEESIASFVRRRLGEEILDYAVAPFVGGVYAGDPERLSIRWALPKLERLEREHGSLVRGLRALRKTGKTGRGRMFSFRGGLEELPRRLAERIGSLRTGVRVRRILAGAAGPVAETDNEKIHARQLVLAAPASEAARLLHDATRGESDRLSNLPYASVAVVSLGVRRQECAHPLDGFGFLAPRRENLRILGALFTSEIYSGRAPDDCAALSVFLGGSTDPEAVSLSDEEISRIVRSDLERAIGFHGQPIFERIDRAVHALPQYELGHGSFVGLAREIESNFQGLSITGNYLHGVSVPDCIQSGTAIARKILAHWNEPPATHSVNLYRAGSTGAQGSEIEDSQTPGFRSTDMRGGEAWANKM